MTETLTTREFLRLRMRALGLTVDGWASAASAAVSGTGTATGTGTGTETASGAERIAATARRMLAIQGQDWRSSRWALGVRTPGTSAEDVKSAFNERLIVRSWPMRGTIHVVAAEDIGWMQAATGHRVLAGAPKRREFLGMSDEVLERLVDVSLAALRGGEGLVRDELATIWTEAGIDWHSSWRYHLIWWLCQNGHATFGPVHGDAEPRLVLAEEWIREPRRLSGDEALAELAVRYAAPRGPVRVRDLAWWTGLTMREAKRGIELAAETGALVPVEISDAALWVDPELLGSPLGEIVPAWHLLPSFDEHLLGYTDREAQLDPQHFERIVPGRNGMFLATVVSSGRVVGTWKRSPRKNGGLEITPFPDERIDTEALAPEAARWAEFHGREDIPLAVAGEHVAAPPKRRDPGARAGGPLG